MQDEYNELLQQVLAMRLKLEAARADMPNEQLVIEYNNGGGQSGIRENPFYKAYTSLLAAYRRSLETLDKLRRYEPKSETLEHTPLEQLLAEAQQISNNG